MCSKQVEIVFNSKSNDDSIIGIWFKNNEIISSRFFSIGDEHSELLDTLSMQ